MSLINAARIYDGFLLTYSKKNLTFDLSVTHIFFHVNDLIINMFINLIKTFECHKRIKFSFFHSMSYKHTHIHYLNVYVIKQNSIE